MVPALLLLIITVFFCPESPRYHLTRGPNYNVKKAFISMVKLRNTEVCSAFAPTKCNSQIANMGS
jgi:hypothetical protein